MDLVDKNNKYKSEFDLNESTINFVLVIYAFTASIIYIVILIRDYKVESLEQNFLAIPLLLGLFFITYFRKKLKRSIKVAVLLFIVFISFILGLSTLGFLASSKHYVLVFPVFLSFVIPFKRSIVILSLLVVIYLIFGYLYVTESLVYNLSVESYVKLEIAWIIDAIILGSMSWGLLYIGYAYRISLKNNLEKIKLQNKEVDFQKRKFEILFENAFDAITLYKDGKFWDCNRTACEYFGYPKEELLKLSMVDICPEFQPNGRNSVEYSVELITLAINGTPQKFEWIHKHKSGKLFPVSISLNCIEFENEIYVQGILRDISKEKELEKNLISSELRLKEIYENTSDAIFIQDPIDGKILDINETMLKIYGFDDKNELIGKDIDFVSDIENGFNLQKANQKISSTSFKEPNNFEWRGKRKDGSTFWIDVSLTKTTIHNKEAILANVRDIDEKKKNDLLLIEKEETFRKIFSKSADGTLLIKNGKFSDCNEAALKLLETDDVNQIIGRFPWEISPEFQEDGMSSEVKAKLMMENCIKNGTHRFEWNHLDKNNNIVIFDILLTEITINNEQIIHCVWRDITERKQIEKELNEYRLELENLIEKRTLDLQKANLELKSSNLSLEEKNKIIHDRNIELNNTLEELKDAQSRLIQSEKLASLGLLTAGVAHEINNPLNFIMGGYSGLENFFKENKNLVNEDIDTLLDIIGSGLKRTTEIVESLNQFSRDKQKVKEVSNIHTIIDNCLTILQHKSKHRIEINRDYSEKPYTIMCNVGRLHQVFLNLLNNSMQAIEGEGVINIGTTIYKNTISVRIEDSGSGISEENLKKIMEPFFTTKKSGEGTGLGLAISDQIIHEHSGKIKFESELGKGTIVTVTLPINN